VEPKTIGKTDSWINSFQAISLLSVLVPFLKIIRSLISYNKDNATKYISIESQQYNYQNPNIDYSGNPNLQPTIFDN
jgi:hypothetical protein